MITSSDFFAKRVFDLVLCCFLLPLALPIILFSSIIAFFDTGENGFFVQERIGQFGKPFFLLKIRTMKSFGKTKHSHTVEGDPRITFSGRFLRKYKIDELPQLFNVLAGEMSFVGPRPDVRGYADKLVGPDRVLLRLKPGITGPASLKYRNEEVILAQQINPAVYADTVIWPDKVLINLQYYYNWSLLQDVSILVRTLLQ